MQKMKNDSTIVSFRLSSNDKNRITHAAMELGLTMSDFMLMKILEEDRMISIYVETISRNIEKLKTGSIFFISSQLPCNWEIISKRTKKKVFKKVLDLMREGEIEADCLVQEKQDSNKDLLCEKISLSILNLLNRYDDDDD